MKNEEVKLTLFKGDFKEKVELEHAGGGIRAGFPSPAADYMEDRIDFNRDFIINPECTFYAQCTGDSMIEEGIYDGDYLVIDKLVEPENGDIVVAFLDGDFTLKRLDIRKTPNGRRRLFLMPGNPKYDPIEIEEYNDFRIWGTLLYSIKDFSKRHPKKNRKRKSSSKNPLR